MPRNPLDYDGPSINEILYGKKKSRHKKSKKKTTKKKEIKRHIYTADFNYLMDKQKEKCANKDCAKYHGVRQKVTTIKDIDHKIPIKLWELMGKKGNHNARSNLQLLCTGCHRRKTAEDRKKIAKYKKKHGIKTTKRRKTTRKRTTGRKTKSQLDDFLHV